MKRKIILLTEGLTNPHRGKTARNLIYYKPDEVLAVFDRELAGKKCLEYLTVGENVPIIGELNEFPQADTLIIGVATTGGKIPANFKEIILMAIKRKMNIISGLHDYLTDDKEIFDAARKYNVKLWDVRKNDEKDVANQEGINETCLRIQTVGNDCSLGKMVSSLEINLELVKMGYDSKFVATGQTGILIEGDGIPIDSVVGDFINGAAEKLVLQNQSHDIIVIEGQASLVHPRYSSVTLGLLHGAQPHGLIMCYEMGRTHIHGMKKKIPPLEEVIALYEKVGSVMYPCKVIGIAINGKKFSKEEVEIERSKIKEKFGLPTCDVVKNGARELAEAVIEFRKQVIKTKLD